MKNILYFLFCSSILFLSCKDSKPTAPAETTPTEILAEKTIGPDGGTLETEDFKLSVPNGAFSTSAQLKLFAEPGGRSFWRV